MLENALIALREGLEAGLIVGILVAYLQRSGRQALLARLWLGVGIAVAVSLGVGALITWGPYELLPQAQEAIGGGLSLVAVGMVTWMVFWMGTHGATLSRDLRGKVDAVADRSWFAIVLLGAVSVGREGVETAVFVWANVSSAANPAAGMTGVAIGLAIAVALSCLISAGLLRFNLSRFFTWTAVFLIVVAAGVLAYAFGDLHEAGVLPGGSVAWSLGNMPTVLQAVLAGIFNFAAEMTWVQVAAWALYLAVVLPLYVALLRRRSRVRAAGIAAQAPASQPAEVVAAH